MNKNPNPCPSLIEWVTLAIKACTLTGGVLYFVGDNLNTITTNFNDTRGGNDWQTTIADDTGARSLISLALSIVGVVILRICTHALRTLQHYCKGRSRLPGTFNLCSPDHDTETHSLVVVYVHLLTFLIEFDTVLAVVLQRVDMSESFCNSTDQRNLVWFFYGGITGIFCIFQLAIVIIFLMSACCHQKKIYQLTVTLATRNKRRTSVACILGDILLSIAVALAVASYLLAEIPQLLHCYLPGHLKSTTGVRIGLSSFAFVVFVVVSVGFGVRQVCQCVQVKGELEAVDVAGGKIEIRYEVENKCTCCGCCTCTFKKPEKHTSTYTFAVNTVNTCTSNYTYSSNQNKELYKHDVEGIVDFVNGPVRIHTCRCTENVCMCALLDAKEYKHVISCLQSTNLAVKVQKDLKKIAKVHMFGDQPYLVVRTTDNPTIHVYKVRVLTQGELLKDVTNSWSEDEGEPLEVQYEKNSTKYKIHTFHRKRNGKEEEYRYAVQDPPIPTQVPGRVRRGTTTQAAAKGQSSPSHAPIMDSSRVATRDENKETSSSEWVPLQDSSTDIDEDLLF